MESENRVQFEFYRPADKKRSQTPGEQEDLFMEFRQLTERVFYSMYDKEADRPVLGYINGQKYSFMVDTGNSEKHVGLFQNALKDKGLRRPDFIAITHWHWDHTFGMNAVEGITIAHKKTNHKLEEMAKWKWADSEMKKRLEAKIEIEFADTCIRKEYPELSEIQVTTADISYEGRMEIDLGDLFSFSKNRPAGV